MPEWAPEFVGVRGATPVVRWETSCQEARDAFFAFAVTFGSTTKTDASNGRNRHEFTTPSGRFLRHQTRLSNGQRITGTDKVFLAPVPGGDHLLDKNSTPASGKLGAVWCVVIRHQQ